MAKKSVTARNTRRKVYGERDFAKRQELKQIVKSLDASYADKMAAQAKLTTMRRDGSQSRYRNQCYLTKRMRGVYSTFGLSRMALRNLVVGGYIPGLTKSSW